MLAQNKKSKHFLPTFLLILLFLAGLVGLSGYLISRKILIITPLFVHSSDTIGVDVSVYQGSIDFDALAEQNIQFAYIKATEGSTYHDANFAINWQNANASSLTVGAYHFFSFDSSGATQAENYINTVGDLSDTNLIPVVDVEIYGKHSSTPPSKSTVVSELKSFFSVIEHRYGVRPIIYTQDHIYYTYLEDDFADCLYWINSIFYPIQLEFSEPWAIWQYTDRGQLKGYSGEEKYTDMNVLNRSFALSDLTVSAQRTY